MAHQMETLGHDVTPPSLSSTASSQYNSDSSKFVRKLRACDRCRRLKVACLWLSPADEVCVRCTKSRAHCHISVPPFGKSRHPKSASPGARKAAADGLSPANNVEPGRQHRLDSLEKRLIETEERLSQLVSRKQVLPQGQDTVSLFPGNTPSPMGSERMHDYSSDAAGNVSSSASIEAHPSTATSMGLPKTFSADARVYKDLTLTQFGRTLPRFEVIRDSQLTHSYDFMISRIGKNRARDLFHRFCTHYLPSCAPFIDSEDLLSFGFDNLARDRPFMLTCMCKSALTPADADLASSLAESIYTWLGSYFFQYQVKCVSVIYAILFSIEWEHRPAAWVQWNVNQLFPMIYTMEVEIATTTILHPVESLHPKELHFLRLYIYGSALTKQLCTSSLISLPWSELHDTSLAEMDMRKDRELAILNIVKAARLVDEYVHKKPDPSNPEQLIDFMNVSDKYSRYLDGVRSTLISTHRLELLCIVLHAKFADNAEFDPETLKFCAVKIICAFGKTVDAAVTIQSRSSILAFSYCIQSCVAMSIFARIYLLLRFSVETQAFDYRLFRMEERISELSEVMEREAGVTFFGMLCKAILSRVCYGLSFMEVSIRSFPRPTLKQLRMVFLNHGITNLILPLDENELLVPADEINAKIEEGEWDEVLKILNM